MQRFLAHYAGLTYRAVHEAIECEDYWFLDGALDTIAADVLSLIHISMEEAEETWLIPDGAWQIVPGAPNRIYRQTLYVKADAASTRGVEIEAVEYELPRRMTRCV